MFVANTDLNRVLAVNSTATAWDTTIVSTTTEPGASVGAYSFGGRAGQAAGRLLLMPYMAGPPGAVFFIRVFGYKYALGQIQETNLWVPVGIVTLRCMATDSPGRNRGTDVNLPCVVGPNENFCELIEVVQGSLGVGANAGETYGLLAGYPGAVLIDLLASRKFRCDFYNENGDPMNALWGKV